MQKITNDLELAAWVSNALKGERVVYHVGTHAFGDTCCAAVKLWDRGLIHINQRKAGKTDQGRQMWEYLATRAGPWMAEKTSDAARAARRGSVRSG